MSYTSKNQDECSEVGGEQLKTAVGETNVAIHRQIYLHTQRTHAETNAIRTLSFRSKYDYLGRSNMGLEDVISQCLLSQF